MFILGQVRLRKALPRRVRKGFRIEPQGAKKKYRGTAPPFILIIIDSAFLP